MKRTARLLFLAALLPLAAHAQGVRDGNGSVIIRDDVAASRGMDPRKPFFTFSVDQNGNYVAPGGGGGSAASQTASNASDGQATSTTNQQNLVFNMLFNGTTWDRMRGTGGALNTAVTNFPASQAVTNGGTFAVQNTAPVVGGNTAAVKTDGSATTQPVSGSVGLNTLASTYVPGAAACATTATIAIGAGNLTSVRTVKNIDASVNIFIGPSNVTAAASGGFQLKPGEAMTWDTKNTSAALYCIVASGTATLNIIGF